MARYKSYSDGQTFWDIYKYRMGYRNGRIRQELRQEQAALDEGVKVRAKRRRRYMEFGENYRVRSSKRRPHKSWKWQRTDRYEERQRPPCVLQGCIEKHVLIILKALDRIEETIWVNPIELENSDLVLSKIQATHHRSGQGYWWDYEYVTVKCIPHLPLESERAQEHPLQVLYSRELDLNDLEIGELEQLFKSLRRLSRRYR